MHGVRTRYVGGVVTGTRQAAGLTSPRTALDQVPEGSSNQVQPN